VLERRTKDSFTTHAYTGLRRNAPAIRTMLATSHLANAGLLTPAMAALNRAVDGRTAPLGALAHLITAEMWVRSLDAEPTWWTTTPNPSTQERGTSNPTADDPTVDRLRDACAWASTYWPGRAACLETSLAVVIAATLARRRLHWCLGARFDPPATHAWAQTTDGTPVGEPTDLGWPWTTALRI
jgi:hypothetical protein